MGLPEYLQNNSPPRPLVRWMLQHLQIEPLDQDDPGLCFSVTCAAAFCNWVKGDGGTIWLFAVNGVRRKAAGPWDVFTLVEDNKRRSLDSDVVFSWDRTKPKEPSGPVVGAAEAIRYILRQFDTPVPREIVQFLDVNDETTKAEFQNKVALLGSMVAGKWFATEEGKEWAMSTQGILRAVAGLQEVVYSQHLVPIGTVTNVEHTRKGATDTCEQCWTRQPCVEQERDGAMCRRCAGYSGGMNSGAHNVCERCDIVDCPHWKEFFGSTEKQEWLLSGVR